MDFFLSFFPALLVIIPQYPNTFERKGEKKDFCLQHSIKTPMIYRYIHSRQEADYVRRWKVYFVVSFFMSALYSNGRGMFINMFRRIVSLHSVSSLELG